MTIFLLLTIALDFLKMNNIICEVVSSAKNKDKINVYGYLMVKDRNWQNTYYWRYEKYKSFWYAGRATTKLVEDQHQLHSFSDHNHAAKASRVNVVKTIKVLKERVQQNNNQPVQIIQDVVANSSQEIFPYLPSKDALRQTIKRVRHIDSLLSHSL